MHRRPLSDSYQRIYAVVRRIPKGKVATYGQVARLAGLPGHARQVGYAMHALPAGTAVPWHRVINARGEISVRSQFGDEVRQRLLLEAEDVEFDWRGRIPLERYGWRKRRRRG
jgi:methylated-DNA-protein-cysteine methyltransferase-like protein